jgi:hypothetical protein
MVDVKKWMNEKFVTPGKLLSPVQIGLAVAVGVWGGIFPIPTLSTFATLAFVSVLGKRFNTAMSSIAIAVNLLVTPLQFMGMPFFLSLPAKFSSLAPCSVGDLMTSIKEKPLLETCTTFGTCMFWAVVGWGTLSAPAIFMLRWVVISILKRLKR